MDTETGIAKNQIRLYQWNDAELKIDHCSISGMTLKLFPDGRWSVSLRADQNPQNLQSTKTPDGRATYIAHLKGNGVDLNETPMTVGPVLKMDAKTETFTNNNAANAMLTRKYRKNFEVSRTES